MSNLFSEFCEDIEIELSNEDHGHAHNGLRAYRMDGKPGMREKAGLGSGLHCCDYLWIDESGYILIEITKLSLTVNRLLGEHNKLRSDKEIMRKLILNDIQNENLKKVYGSMLVLCCMNQREGPERCSFRLVISGKWPGTRALRHWDPENKLWEEIQIMLSGASGAGQSRSIESLAGTLRSSKLASEVKVVTYEHLCNELLMRCSAST